MTLKQTLIRTIQDVLAQNGLSDTSVMIEQPEEMQHGDYATNAALIAAKKAHKNAQELAGELRDILLRREIAGIKKIEVAGPGFLNFWVDEKYLMEKLQVEFSTSFPDSFAGKKILVEFTDPNPFKEFHIGHLYSNTIGEALCRLLEKNGAQVVRLCYQGDVGLHVAKAMWGMREKMKDEGLQISNIEDLPLEKRAKFLGEVYSLGATAYEENPEVQEETKILNKKVFVKDPEIMELYQKGREWSLEYFDQIYKRLGVHFDKFYYESEVGEFGASLVREYLEKGIFEESQGAVIFPGEKYGLHSRVFINSLGLPTYEAKELGLARKKAEDYPDFDLSIVITGNEINEYFKVLLKALSLIYPEIAEKTRHISHGMVRLPEGKMSSRTGKVITGEWLLDTAKQMLEKLHQSEWEEHEQISEMVSVGAIKYALLRSGVGRDIEFDFEETISFEGNSGPYLQYTYVRTQSVLRKAQLVNGKKEVVNSLLADLQPEEEVLLRMMGHFEEIVLTAGEKYAPNILCTYLFQLAQRFNLFYQKLPILHSEDETRERRLLLTQAVGERLQIGLNLLGIQAPERM